MPDDRGDVLDNGDLDFEPTAHESVSSKTAALDVTSTLPEEQNGSAEPCVNDFDEFGASYENIPADGDAGEPDVRLPNDAEDEDFGDDDFDDFVEAEPASVVPESGLDGPDDEDRSQLHDDDEDDFGNFEGADEPNEAPGIANASVPEPVKQLPLL
jgi:hypothetical protein